MTLCCREKCACLCQVGSTTFRYLLGREPNKGACMHSICLSFCGKSPKEPSINFWSGLVGTVRSLGPFDNKLPTKGIKYGSDREIKLTFMLPRRLARSMTRNFLMRSLWGEKKEETDSKSTPWQHFSKQIDKKKQKKKTVLSSATTQKWENASLLQVDWAVSPWQPWSRTNLHFQSREMLPKGKSCRWAERIGSHVWKAADGLMAAKCCQVSNLPRLRCWRKGLRNDTQGKYSNLCGVARR